MGKNELKCGVIMRNNQTEILCNAHRYDKTYGYLDSEFRRISGINNFSQIKTWSSKKRAYASFMNSGYVNKVYGGKENVKDTDFEAVDIIVGFEVKVKEDAVFKKG